MNHSMLRNGESAPAFSLLDQDGATHDLAALSGKPIVLLFFRGAFCPTTWKSIPAWQDFSRSMQDLGAELLGLSSDTPEHHAEMRERFRLTFPLLSDPDLQISKLYGVYPNWVESRGHFGEPALVIVDSEGKVAYSVISSGPKGLPEPGSIAPILIYMSFRGGKY